jgi:hypothetical protein
MKKPPRGVGTHCLVTVAPPVSQARPAYGNFLDTHERDKALPKRKRSWRSYRCCKKRKPVSLAPVKLGES